MENFVSESEILSKMIVDTIPWKTTHFMGKARKYYIAYKPLEAVHCWRCNSFAQVIVMEGDERNLGAFLCKEHFFWHRYEDEDKRAAAAFRPMDVCIILETLVKDSPLDQFIPEQYYIPTVYSYTTLEDTNHA